ncbi:conserved hypothetical protein [Cupriavidus necator]|uniref:HTH hxlR-type domain-containing protein n=2 Tax=Cupriavidus necator TaxID=106590 RepID=A0A1K0JCU8_CUPNE|nr:conserved hypothetical protein [Cupriavidus necator]
MEIHRQAIRSCAVTRTLAILGERWTLLILREAIHGLVRFDQFEKSLGISPTTLSPPHYTQLLAAGAPQKVVYGQ